MNFPILSSLIFLPSIGALFLFFTKSNNEKNFTVKYVALFTSLVNFFLSIIAIQFSYFYFGTQNYFYPQYLISEIFKSAIIITAFFSLVMLLTKSVIKSFFPRVILNLFQSFLIEYRIFKIKLY